MEVLAPFRDFLLLSTASGSSLGLTVLQAAARSGVFAFIPVHCHRRVVDELRRNPFKYRCPEPECGFTVSKKRSEFVAHLQEHGYQKDDAYREAAWHERSFVSTEQLLAQGEPLTVEDTLAACNGYSAFGGHPPEVEADEIREPLRQAIPYLTGRTRDTANWLVGALDGLCIDAKLKLTARLAQHLGVGPHRACECLRNLGERVQELVRAGLIEDPRYSRNLRPYGSYGTSQALALLSGQDQAYREITRDAMRKLTRVVPPDWEHRTYTATYEPSDAKLEEGYETSDSPIPNEYIDNRE